MPHTSPMTTILTTLGLFCFSSLALAAEGDLPATQETDQATTENLEIVDALIEIELPDGTHLEQEVEATVENGIMSIEIVDPIETDESSADNQESSDEPADPANESHVISMDRSDWPTIVVSPIDGKVTHHPHFTGEAPLGEDIVTPLHAPEPVWQLQEALAGAHAGNLNGENLSHLGSQPFVGLTQFVLMPVRMVLENPLSKETSPDSE